MMKFNGPQANSELSPGGSDGKESACNAGEPGSIPGLGRAPGEGNDNPFQYSCLEKSTDRGAWLGRGSIRWGHNESDTTEWLTLSLSNSERQFDELKNKINEQNEFFTKETEILKKNQILELKNSMNEVKNTLESLRNRADQTEERISNLKDRNLGMTQEWDKIFKKWRNPKRAISYEEKTKYENNWSM